MTLTKKFIIWIITSILLIAITNILAFYIFYWFYLKLYLYEKAKTRDSVTIDFINDIIKKKTKDDIDNIFSDAELEFFELLETNNWKISLDKEKNTDIVINYLVKSWLTPKYIEEIIPTDNFRSYWKWKLSWINIFKSLYLQYACHKSYNDFANHFDFVNIC